MKTCIYALNSHQQHGMQEVTLCIYTGLKINELRDGLRLHMLHDASVIIATVLAIYS